MTASNVTIAMGGGSGHLTLGNWWGGGGIDADGNVTIDASSFGGRIDTQRIIASGSVVASLQGHFSAGEVASINDFTIQATGLAGGSIIWLDKISAGGSTTFDYGDGIVANLSVSSVQTQGAFTFNASSATTGTITANTISAESVSMDFGAISGWATISSIASQSSILLDANQAPNLLMDIENVRASGDVTVRLGAVSEGWRAASISAIQTSNGEVSIEAHAYREKFDVDFISASSVSVAFGDLSDQFYASGIYTNNFTLVGGDGANFSASISN